MVPVRGVRRAGRSEVNEIELAGFVDRLQGLAADGILVYATNDERVTERDAELANAELERRIAGIKVVRIEGFSIR